MSSVVLIYPFRRPRRDRATFRLPPLGLAYVAEALRRAGHDVSVLDCTFLDEAEVVRRAGRMGADVAGIYSMIGMGESALRIARALRGKVAHLIVGGPLASVEPELFREDFDVAVRGEGEVTAVEVLAMLRPGGKLRPEGEREGLRAVAGISYFDRARGRMTHTPSRRPADNLDAISFPARDLLPNDAYIADGRRRYGYSITSVMSSRGCPYSCEFCSNPVFGRSFRTRSAANVVDELEQVVELGYERVHFADDVFTLDRRRLLEICRQIETRKLRLKWECLARVDSLDRVTADAMRAAGCFRVYFGIESGDDRVLALMGKKIDRKAVQRGVSIAAAAGMETGGFFIVCYPGDTDATVLDTIRFARRLPLQYASFTMPHALPGTALHRRVGNRSDFSRPKMKLARLKGRTEFYLSRHGGAAGRAGAYVFEKATNVVFRALS